MSAGSGYVITIQSGACAKRIFQIGSSRPSKAAQQTWAQKPFPKSDRSEKLVTIAAVLRPTTMRGDRADAR